MKDLVISASAGTGKTYQLARRYLQLLLLKNESPQNILATTFTRKAAGEIQNRILSILAKASENKDNFEALLAMLGENGSPAELTREQVQGALKSLLKNLNRLNISTLDSFFNQQAQCFSLELGLPRNWQIMDDAQDKEIRQRVLSDLLQENDIEDKKGFVYTFLQYVQDGKLKRSVFNQLSSVVKDLYTTWKEAPRTAWDALKVPKYSHDEAAFKELLENAISLMSNDEDLTENQRDKIIEDLEVIYDSDSQDPRARYDAVLKMLCHKHSQCIWESVNHPENGVKLSAKRILQDPKTVDALIQVIRYMEWLVKKEWKKDLEFYQTTLESFHKKYWSRKKDAGMLVFDDIPWLLTQEQFVNQRSNDSDSFRMDGSIRHLLLDEFQDTSLAQWAVLKPLYQKTRNSDDCSFFCVGDVKQAIYGWRGGEAQLLENLLNEEGMDKMDMSESRRSYPAIMEAVNTVFMDIGSNPVLLDYSTIDLGPGYSDRSMWGRPFIKHNSFIKSKNEKDKALKAKERMCLSYAELSTAPAPDDENASNADIIESTYEHVAKRIKKLHDDSKDLNLEIGVLVRENDDVAMIANCIKSLGLECSQEGKSPLLDSYEVRQILALLKWIDHPGDAYSYYVVSQSALAQTLIENKFLKDGQHPLTDNKNRVQAEFDDCKNLNRIRYGLYRDGYGLTVQRWAEVLKKEADARNVRRLEIFEELAHQYDSMGSTRTDDFIKFIEGSMVFDAFKTRIRVMTYHQSKGLEFDIVVMPQLHIPLIGKESYLIVKGRKNAVQPPNEIIRYANSGLRFLLPPKQQLLFGAARKKLMQESLCLLYVAMTRAKQGLYMIAAPKMSREEKETYKNALFAGLPNNAGEDSVTDEGGVIHYSAGDPGWINNSIDKKSHETESVEKAVKADVVRDDGAPVLPSRGEKLEVSADFKFLKSDHSVCVPLPASAWKTKAKPMSFVNVVTAKIEDLDSSDSTLSQSMRGTLFHCWLADIKWIEEYRVDDQRLIDLGIGIGLQKDSFVEFLPAFKSLLKQPAVISALTRPDGSWEAYEEKNVAGILKDQEGTECLVSGAIDRLTVHRTADGKVDKAIILDYKTVHKGKDIADVRAQYAGQMDAYRQIVSKMYGVPVSSVETTLLVLEGDF